MNIEKYKNTEFTIVKKAGYDTEQVDHVMAELIEGSEGLSVKVKDLERKISLLAVKIQEYRQDEEVIKKTLVIARKSSDEMVVEAEEEAKKILEEAEEKSAKLVEEATQRSADLLNEATQRSADLLNEAEIDASSLYNKYDAQTKVKKEQLEEVQKQATILKASMLKMYRQHIELVAQIPDFNYSDIDAEDQLEENSIYKEDFFLKTPQLGTEEIEPTEEEEQNHVDPNKFDFSHMGLEEDFTQE